MILFYDKVTVSAIDYPCAKGMQVIPDVCTIGPENHKTQEFFEKTCNFLANKFKSDCPFKKIDMNGYTKISLLTQNCLQVGFACLAGISTGILGILQDVLKEYLK